MNVPVGNTTVGCSTRGSVLRKGAQDHARWKVESGPRVILIIHKPVVEKIADRINTCISLFVVEILICRVEVVSEANDWYMQEQETSGWEDCYRYRCQHR
jgi:hypothetical protein